MSPNYRKRRREKQLHKSRAGVLARERKRLAFDPDRENWRVVRTCLMRVWAGPDGRSMAIYIDGTMFRRGSERAVRGALARALWGKGKV